MALWRGGGMAGGMAEWQKRGMAEWYFTTYLIYPAIFMVPPTMPMMPTTPKAFKSFRCTDSKLAQQSIQTCKACVSLSIDI